MRGFWQWRWHLDEMYVKLNGEMVYLWRVVDQEGKVLEGYVTRTRDKAAARIPQSQVEQWQFSPLRQTRCGGRCPCRLVVRSP